MAVKNKSILDVRAKMHRSIASVTSKNAVIMPSERRDLNVRMSHKTPYQKKYAVSKDPRSL